MLLQLSSSLIDALKATAFDTHQLLDFIDGSNLSFVIRVAIDIHPEALMAVSIRKTMSVKFEDSKEWIIPEDCLLEVDGQTFVKLAGSNYGFAKLVCYDIKGIRNMSAASSPGLAELQKFRNDAKPMADDQKEELFEKKGKKKRVESGIVCQMHVPPFDDSQGGNVLCLSASHPKADLAILLDAEALALCVKFIRHLGVDPDNKRAYNNDAETESSNKLIKMGNGRVAQKLHDGKLKYVKRLEE